MESDGASRTSDPGGREVRLAEAYGTRIFDVVE